MRKVVLWMVLGIFLTSVSFVGTPCFAGEKEDILKKIEGAYGVKRYSRDQRYNLDGREIGVKLKDFLLITERSEGLPDQETQIPLQEIISGDSLSFKYCFRGDIGHSTIKVSRDGRISGETLRRGGYAAIEFLRK